MLAHITPQGDDASTVMDALLTPTSAWRQLTLAVNGRHVYKQAVFSASMLHAITIHPILCSTLTSLSLHQTGHWCATTSYQPNACIIES